METYECNENSVTLRKWFYMTTPHTSKYLEHVSHFYIDLNINQLMQLVIKTGIDKLFSQM